MCDEVCMPVMQYLEVAFNVYRGYRGLALFLGSMTVVSCFVASWALYKERVQLFNSIGQHRLTPLVQAGHVRSVVS